MAESSACSDTESLVGQPMTCIDAWGLALASAAAREQSVVVLVNDSISSAGLGTFAKRFPDRVIDVGIAEQNLVSVAAGLAMAGKTVFVSSAASFLTGRALEQIKIDVAYARTNVKLIGQSPGVSYGPLGPTHHAIEDITWMSALPGVPVVAPSNPAETMAAVSWAASWPQCVYIRIPRKLYGNPPALPTTFEFGRATVVRAGCDVTLLTTGAAAGLAVAAADILALERIEAQVICMSTVKPLDTDQLLDAATKTAGIVTVEDGIVNGLGGSVAAFLAEQRPTPIRRIGFRDQFATLGVDDAILERAGIGVNEIASAARSLCQSSLVRIPGPRTDEHA